MKKVGIICAMNEEMNEIKKIMTNISTNEYFGLEFFEGVINKKECILVECGIGKVNAARTTQIMLDKFEIEFIVNIGTAGAIDSSLNVTDVVIGESLVQHDFDITAFSHPRGYITGVGRKVFSDKNLVENCKKIMETMNKENSYNVISGTIASGDVFCTKSEMAKDILEEFGAVCVEMEGAAIAQICFLDKIPFIVIRSISDSPNGNNNIDFDKYLEIASKRGAEFLKELLI